MCHKAYVAVSFHADRASGCHRHHCYPGLDAVAGFGEGTKQGDILDMSGKSQADGLGLYSYMDDHDNWLPPMVTSYSKSYLWTSNLYDGKYLTWSINTPTLQQGSTIATCPMPALKYTGTYGMRMCDQWGERSCIYIADKPKMKIANGS